VRIALAYHLSYYLRHPDDGYAKNEIIKLLQATADPGEAEKIKKDLEEDLTNIFRDFVLKIRPVNWESFAEYIRAQKVISESA
jgi:hypothetical protein